MGRLPADREMKDDDSQILLPPEVLSILELLANSNTGKDPELFVAKTRQALSLLSPAKYPYAWAYLKYLSGVSLRNLWRFSAAVEDLRSALDVWDAESHIEDWVEARRELACCFLFDPVNRDRHIELAIGILETLLAFEKEKDLDSWPVTLSALGDAYKERITGDPKHNLKVAADSLEAALDNLDPEELPVDFVDASVSSAEVYCRDMYPSIAGTTRESAFRRALDLLYRAVEICERFSLPHEKAMVLRDLAQTISESPVGDLAANVEQAIELSETGLELLRKNGPDPLEPTFLINLASYHFERLKGSRSDNVERAIRFATEALEALSPEGFPSDWRRALSALGIAYSERVDDDRRENLQRSVELLNRLLESCPEGSFADLRITALSN